MADRPPPPTPAEMLELTSLIPTPIPPPPFAAQVLTPLVDVCRTPWLRDFLFHPSPLHIHHLSSHKAPALTCFHTLTHVEPVAPSPSGPLFGESRHHSASLVFLPAVTADHITLGFGLMDSLITLGAPWLPEGTTTCPSRLDFRFVRDARKGVLLLIYNETRADFILLHYTQIESTTVSHKLHVKLRRARLLASLDGPDDPLSTEKLLNSLDYFHNEFQTRPCLVCGAAPEAFCGCPVPLERPAHPWDIQHFANTMLYYFGNFRSVASKVFLGADPTGRHVLLGSRTVFQGVRDPALVTSLTRWSLQKHARTVRESPWPSLDAPDPGLGQGGTRGELVATHAREEVSAVVDDSDGNAAGWVIGLSADDRSLFPSEPGISESTGACLLGTQDPEEETDVIVTTASGVVEVPPAILNPNPAVVLIPSDMDASQVEGLPSREEQPSVPFFDIIVPQDAPVNDRGGTRLASPTDVPNEGTPGAFILTGLDDACLEDPSRVDPVSGSETACSHEEDRHNANFSAATHHAASADIDTGLAPESSAGIQHADPSGAHIFTGGSNAGVGEIARAEPVSGIETLDGIAEDSSSDNDVPQPHAETEMESSQDPNPSRRREDIRPGIARASGVRSSESTFGEPEERLDPGARGANEGAAFAKELKAEIRKEKNRAAARRSNLREKLRREGLKQELEEAREKVEELRAKDVSLRKENLRLRRLRDEPP